MSAEGQIEIVDRGLLMKLTGAGGEQLRAISGELGVALGVRGQTLFIKGEEAAVQQAERTLTELLMVLGTRSLSTQDILRSARTAIAHPEVRLKDLFDDVILKTPSKRAIAPKGPAQQHYVNAFRSHDIVFGIGPAGTGKTYLAVAMAVAALQERRVQRIILTRPAVEAGEKLGFLPGDLADKVNPYLRPLYDALNEMMEPARVMDLMERGTIEVAPLAFMRGRTLNDAFVILDEAQNTTPQQMKMFLTRLGFRSRTAVTGDVTQTDLPRGTGSGLADVQHLLKNVEGISFCRFTDEDVVRHPLVQRIIRRYDERDAKRMAKKAEKKKAESEKRS